MAQIGVPTDVPITPDPSVTNTLAADPHDLIKQAAKAQAPVPASTAVPSTSDNTNVITAAASSVDLSIPTDLYERLAYLADHANLTQQAQDMIAAADKGQTWAIRDIGLGLINGQYGFGDLGDLSGHIDPKDWGAQLLQDAANKGDEWAQINTAYFEYHGQLDPTIAHNSTHALDTINGYDRAWVGGESLLDSYHHAAAPIANDNIVTTPVQHAVSGNNVSVDAAPTSEAISQTADLSNVPANDVAPVLSPEEVALNHAKISMPRPYQMVIVLIIIQ